MVYLSIGLSLLSVVLLAYLLFKSQNSEGKDVEEMLRIQFQKEFLIKMGIYERAEIISRNQSFLKKADIYYRLKRLVDDKQMGKLFKVMLIKNKKNKFKLGF